VIIKGEALNMSQWFFQFISWLFGCSLNPFNWWWWGETFESLNWIVFYLGSTLLCTTSGPKNKNKNKIPFKQKYWMTLHETWIEFNWVHVCLNKIQIHWISIEEECNANWYRNWKFACYFHHLWPWCWKKKLLKKPNLKRHIFILFKLDSRLKSILVRWNKTRPHNHSPKPVLM
jgi:hypothetical protein